MQRIRKATIQDVAKLANLSHTTVTRALSKFKQASISPETRERAMAAARELKYSPCLMAQQLKTGRVRTVCMTFVESSDTILSPIGAGPVTLGYNDAIHGARTILDPIGYRIVPFHSPNRRKAEELLPQMFAGGYFEAAFFPHLELNEIAVDLARAGCIVIGAVPPVKGLPNLVHVPRETWKMDFGIMFEEVIRQGRKQILSTIPVPDSITSSFSDELQSGRIRLEHFEKGERSTARYVSSIVEAVLSRPIDAIVTADEFLGWDIFKGLQQCGVEAPERVTITGAADVRHVFKPLPVLQLGYAEKALQSRAMACRLVEVLATEEGSVKFPPPRPLLPFRNRIQTMTPAQFLTASRAELCREHLLGEVEAEILGEND